MTSIQTIKTELKNYLRKLEMTIQEVSKKIKIQDSQPLTVRNKSGKNTYMTSCNGKQVYLGKNKTQQLKELEEQNYLFKLKTTAENEAITIEKMLKTLDKTADIDEVFLKIAQPKRHLIEPIAEKIQLYNTSDFCEMSEKAKKKNNKNVTEHTYKTSDGVKVRSKSELIIAERLIANNIPYFYEPNIWFENLLMVFKPDFQVLNKRTGESFYWEHFGMMDNANYLKEFQFKMNVYAEGGYFPGRKLIISTESSTEPLNTETIDLMIKEYLL